MLMPVRRLIFVGLKSIFKYVRRDTSLIDILSEMIMQYQRNVNVKGKVAPVFN
jgi:hypothetical protein